MPGDRRKFILGLFFVLACLFGHFGMTLLALYINVLMIIKNLNDLFNTCVLSVSCSPPTGSFITLKYIKHLLEIEMYLISGGILANLVLHSTYSLSPCPTHFMIFKKKGEKLIV